MKRPQRVLISAGELSGELLALSLVKSLKQLRPDLEFVGIAGSLLQAEGVIAWIDSEELAVMGFYEVLALLPKLIKIEERLFTLIDQNPPDIAILVDYPGFHFRIAPSLKARTIPVIQYVAPKVWAWGEKRVLKLKNDFDLVLGILPFETEFFNKHQVPYQYVGSPHIDRVEKVLISLKSGFALESESSPSQSSDKVSSLGSIPSQDASHDISHSPGSRKWITMLPGSRRSEIKMMLSPLLMIGMKLIEKDPSYRFVIPVASGLDFDWVVKLISSNLSLDAFHEPEYSEVGRFRLYREKSLELMKLSDFAVVTSGTATLECGLIGTPLCVVYRMNKLSYFIAKKRIRVKWIGLVNLCAEKEIAKEFIQDLNPASIADHIHQVVSNPLKLRAARSELIEMKARFQGGAELTASKKILEILDRL